MMSKGKLQILLVEDEQSHATAIKRSLQNHSPAFEVVTADTLQQGTEEIEACDPDLLLLDLNLPDGSAIDYLKKNREHRLFPVLIMTSQGNDCQNAGYFCRHAAHYRSFPA